MLSKTMAKDLFGNKKPVKIEIGEYWFNGNIIQLNNHPKLKPFIVFADKERKGDNVTPQGFYKYSEAIEYCLNNPCRNPDHLPKDFGV